MTACDNKAIAVMILGSAPLTGSAMFSVTQAIKLRHNVRTVGVTVAASRWFQIQSVLGQYAPNTNQGYARVIRTSGSNPFIAYAVINDGAHSGERSGDGAFIASSP